MMATAARPMTTAEFLALPQDDGVERLLIKGELLEYPMPYRNRYHSRTMTRVARFLDVWADTQPEPRGQVLTGDAGVRLATDPDTTFGIDVAYVSAEVMARQSDDESTIVYGLPELAVEILSPGELMERHEGKLDAYLEAGVKLVWVLNPWRKTVTAFRPGADPVFFAGRQEVIAPDVLPGFRVPAADLFG
jgi:Uma2 family endonuclease